MPISTAGFQVGVMPRYSPIDPSLVAFDPSQILGGASQAVSFAQQLAQRKAFLAQQAEIEATRQARIDAQNASNQGIVDVTPHRSIADIALADQTAILAPSGTRVGLAKNQAALGDLAFNEQMRPMNQDLSLINVDTAQQAARFKNDNQLPVLQTENDVAVAKGQFDTAKYRDDLDSITEDKALTDAEKVARIRNLNASASQSEANAAYLERNKPKAGMPKTVDDLQKQLGHIETSIQRLEGRKVANPNLDNQGLPVPILQYQGGVHDPVTGKVIMKSPMFGNLPFIGGPDVAMKTNPAAESDLSQLGQLYKLRENYTNQLTSALAGQEAPQAGQIDVTRGLANLQPVAPGQQVVAPVAPTNPASVPLSPAEASKLAPGTVFLGTDGKQHVRK